MPQHFTQSCNSTPTQETEVIVPLKTTCASVGFEKNFIEEKKDSTDKTEGSWAVHCFNPDFDRAGNITARKIIIIMARKMMLVPATENNLQHQPILSQLSALDQNMKSILDDQFTPPDLKIQKYYAALNQFGSFNTAAKQIPLPVTLADNQKTGVSTTTALDGRQGQLPVSEKELLDSIPKAKQRNAALLLKYINSNPEISWNSAKELVFQGKRIPQSNIYSLVNDFSRESKHRSPAQGHAELSSALASQNVPREAFGNSTRWNYVADRFYNLPRHEATPQFQTPVTSNRGRLSPPVTRSGARHRHQGPPPIRFPGYDDDTDVDELLSTVKRKKKNQKGKGKIQWISLYR